MNRDNSRDPDVEIRKLMDKCNLLRVSLKKSIQDIVDCAKAFEQDVELDSIAKNKKESQKERV